MNRTWKNRTVTNRSSIRKVTSQLMAWMVLPVLCAAVARAQDTGAPAQPQGQPTAQQGPRTDGQIEMDVVHALDGSAALKNDLITAATIQGEVTLSGTVSSDASKQLAESIASHVDGVTKVHDNLQIGNCSRVIAKFLTTFSPQSPRGRQLRLFLQGIVQ